MSPLAQQAAEKLREMVMMRTLVGRGMRSHA
jgi:hypothetical protein